LIGLADLTEVQKKER